MVRIRLVSASLVVRFVVVSVLSLLLVISTACNKGSSPIGPTPVEPPVETLPPSDLTPIPSEWKYMVNRDTGEVMPIKVRLLYLSPQPGASVTGGVIPMQGCGDGSPYCIWNKVEVCVETDQVLFSRPDGWSPAPNPDISVLGSPAFSMTEEGREYGATIGSKLSSDGNGCYTYGLTPETEGNGFTLFPELVPALGPCCEFLNIPLIPFIRRVGGTENGFETIRASVSFKVGYRLH